MVVLTSLFNLVISPFPDNMFYHVWTTLLIYHDGSNDVVQLCSFIKPWTVCYNMNKCQACRQHCSSWPAQPCSSLSAGKNKLCVFTSEGESIEALLKCNALSSLHVYLLYKALLHFQAALVQSAKYELKECRQWPGEMFSTIHTFISAPDKSSFAITYSDKSTSFESVIRLVWMLKIRRFVFSSGSGNSIFRSIRPK